MERFLATITMLFRIGADAGDGWYVAEYMSHRKASIMGFDEKVA